MAYNVNIKTIWLNRKSEINTEPTNYNSYIPLTNLKVKMYKNIMFTLKIVQIPNPSLRKKNNTNDN